MKRSTAEAYACISLGVWLLLKLLTFIFTPLLNIMRWPLHILFLISAALWLYFLYLNSIHLSKRKQS